MRRRQVVAAALLGLLSGCGDYGPDYENTVVYPGPCSGRAEGPQLGAADFSFEYAAGRLVKVRSDWELPDGTSGWDETNWEWNLEGSLDAIRSRTSFYRPDEDREVWTFEPSRVVVTFRGEPWSVYDRSTFAFEPIPGSVALSPLAELGMVEHRGVAYTWTTEGELLVRTGSDQRATYQLDPMGRIVVLTRDLGNDGTIDMTLRSTFDGDRLVRKTSENAGNPWSVDWRYDRAGNIASSSSESGGYGPTMEEYDYGCW